MTNDHVLNPIPLAADHELHTFDCGVPMLDEWLKKRAWRNETSGVSRTYVIDITGVIAGYYTLATGAIARREAPKNLQRNSPDPIPMIVLGRLAVDTRYQGQGLGTALLRDSVLRTLAVSHIAGVKSLLVHAVSEEARAFYVKRGFQESPLNRMTLCLRLEEVRAESQFISTRDE